MGASLNPKRFAFVAMKSLAKHGHPVVAIGASTGAVEGISIYTKPIAVKGIDTVTLYLSAERQKDYIQYIIALHPKRIIFNPGSENPVLRIQAEAAGIEVLYACTLNLLKQELY